DGVAAGMGAEAVDVGWGLHVAVADDGQGQLLFDLGDGVPIGTAVVLLGFGTAVDGDQRRAVVGHDLGDLQIIPLVVVPAQANFTGNRHRQMGRKQAKGVGYQLRLGQHACTRTTPADLAGGATHVDV